MFNDAVLDCLKENGYMARFETLANQRVVEDEAERWLMPPGKLVIGFSGLV